VTLSAHLDADAAAGYGVAYNVAKVADDRLATCTALAADGVASVAQHPGLVRTEGVTQFAEHLDLTDSRSPQGVGRVVAALAADPEVMSLTGRRLSWPSWQSGQRRRHHLTTPRAIGDGVGRGER